MRNVNTFKEYYPLFFYMYSSYCLNKRNLQAISQVTNLVKIIVKNLGKNNFPKVHVLLTKVILSLAGEYGCK